VPKDKRIAWPHPVQIQLSGSGGQGIILAGIILASGAISDGHYAVQTQAYGPEARGGASRAEVIIGSELIDYPRVERPDILLVLTQEACDKYLPNVVETSLVIVDSLLVKNIPKIAATVIEIPIIETAQYKVGREVVANIVALGALNEATNLVSWSSLEAAVLKRVPKIYQELNIKALKEGRNLI